MGQGMDAEKYEYRNSKCETNPNIESRKTRRKQKRDMARMAMPRKEERGRFVDKDEYTTYCVGEWGCIIVRVSED
jgi:hypothetical protein